MVTYGAGSGVGIAVANGTQTLDAARAVLGFSVGNDVNSPITINSGGAGTNTLTIGTSGILLNSGSGGGITVNADIILSGARSWTTGNTRTITANNVDLGSNLLTIAAVGTGNNTTITGLISGTGGITKSFGQNAFITGADNTFSGQVIVAGGTLNINKLADGGSNSSLSSTPSGERIGNGWWWIYQDPRPPRIPSSLPSVRSPVVPTTAPHLAALERCARMVPPPKTRFI